MLVRVTWAIAGANFFLHYSKDLELEKVGLPSDKYKVYLAHGEGRPFAPKSSTFPHEELYLRAGEDTPRRRWRPNFHPSSRGESRSECLALLRRGRVFDE